MVAAEFARPVVFGTANGAAFALVAIGLVLIYKSSRVFNFAAGEFVTIGAFGAYVAKGFLPYPFAMLVGIAAGAVAGLLTEAFVIRPLADRPRVTLLVATAAVALIAIPVEVMVGGLKAFPARKAFTHGITFLKGVPILGHLSRPLGPKVLGVYLSAQQLMVLAALIAAGLLLAWFFARTDLGLAVLASSQEPFASQVVGVRLARVSMLMWGMAGLLGGLAGVLLAPVSAVFTAGYGTSDLLIPAFAAAVLGGMTSVPGAFVGGVTVGIAQSFAQFNLDHVPFTSTQLPGSNSIAVLLVLIAVLLIRPTGILGTEA